MNNRFLEDEEHTGTISEKQRRCGGHRPRNADSGFIGGGKGVASFQSSVWAQPFTAQDRVLVILIENGGVDLGIPALVEKLLASVPGASLIPGGLRQKLVAQIREAITGLTDKLLESAELTANRYAAAKPDLFGDVVVLRDGTSSYQDLKGKLLALSRDGKILDLFILTHGSADSISVPGGISGQKIRDMKAENGKPLSIRSVYMMNCVGSSLNQAWIDAGAKVSSGSLRNNYLPEPTMFFFWKNWKEGQTFENAVTSAYRKTINLANEAIRTVLRQLPIPGAESLAANLDFENLEFVKDSAPVIQGQRSVTINSDALSFSQSNSSSLATTVLPISLLRSLGVSQSTSAPQRQSNAISQQGIDFIKRWEGFRATIYNDPVGHCTVGYGTLLHTGNCDGRPSEQPYINGITEEQATQLLVQKAAEFQRIVNDNVNVELNQNQHDALVSFVYNIGGSNFLKSTLLRRLNQADYATVPTEMKKWTKASQNGTLIDLPGLVKRREAEAALFTAPIAALAQSALDGLSRPFYDTGEHTILGQFINNAISGPLANVHALLPTTTYVLNTVGFTYGQIMTLGDFYDNYNACQAAPAAELSRLKTLIVRSENHYKNSILGIGGPAADVASSEWASPTIGLGPRYLDLAVRNNSHFAPPPSGTASSLANNRQSWETYHARAIQTARAGNNSSALDAAYPINAFGDHFLTDSFSAGHLINKERVMNAFIGNVITGSSVNSAGDRMFEQVAAGALAKPGVKSKLGRYELTDSVLGKHFNLDTTFPVHVFHRVLKGIMEDTASGGQQQISNLAVKAVHDVLSNYQSGGTRGVPVKNLKGNSWNLTGDGTLNLVNIAIIQLAVKQSVENIEDGVRNPVTPLATYYSKVWDYVPILTNPATRAIVDNTVAIYTNPSSSQLVAKAVELIEREVDTLLGALLRAGKIRLA